MPDLVRKSTDATVKSALTESSATMQTKNFIAYDREPALKEIPDQGFVLATVAGTVYIYSRIGIKRYKVALTLV